MVIKYQNRDVAKSVWQNGFLSDDDQIGSDHHAEWIEI